MISTKKAYELLLASAVLTNVAAEAFKKDDNIYKHKNKRLLNELVNNNLYLLKQRELVEQEIGSQRVAEMYSKINGIEIDSELALENHITSQRVLINLIYLYIALKDTSDLYMLDTLIDNITQHKKVYTEIELLDKLKTAANYYSNFEISENNLKKFI